MVDDVPNDDHVDVGGSDQPEGEAAAVPSDGGPGVAQPVVNPQPVNVVPQHILDALVQQMQALADGQQVLLSRIDVLEQNPGPQQHLQQPLPQVLHPQQQPPQQQQPPAQQPHPQQPLQQQLQQQQHGPQPPDGIFAGAQGMLLGAGAMGALPPGAPLAPDQLAAAAAAAKVNAKMAAEL